jgi:hypothetical protein
MLFRGLIQWCKCGALYKKKIRKILYISFLRMIQNLLYLLRFGINIWK